MRLNADTYLQHAIEVERKFGDIGAEHIDRHKVLQILTNLFANARDAVQTNQPDARRIVVQTQCHGDRRLEISIADNGCGIAAEQLDKIFALGYSTKPDGNGIGLHYSACAAQELGGELGARSSGMGQGATFVLVLPTGMPAP